MKRSLFTRFFMFGLLCTLQLQGQINRGVGNVNSETYDRAVLFYLIQGDNLMLQGQDEQAILNYDNAIAQAPCFAESYIRRATAKYKQGRFTEAQEDYLCLTI
jgi:tetratricopeptide (TPR) repeat protein